MSSPLESISTGLFERLLVFSTSIECLIVSVVLILVVVVVIVDKEVEVEVCVILCIVIGVLVDTIVLVDAATVVVKFVCFTVVEAEVVVVSAVVELDVEVVVS